MPISAIIKIVSDGVMSITVNGKEFEVPFPTILAAADEIRDRYREPKPIIPQPSPGRSDIFKNVPDVPKPAGSINEEINPRGKIAAFFYRVFA